MNEQHEVGLQMRADVATGGEREKQMAISFLLQQSGNWKTKTRGERRVRREIQSVVHKRILHSSAVVSSQQWLWQSLLCTGTCMNIVMHHVVYR